MTSTLHFPSEETIQNYLENEHPCTKNNLYMKEKKVLAAAARIFANKKKTPGGVQMDVMLMLRKIKFPAGAAMIATMHLSRALKDCAEGKKFE